jgi:hypothetical protein
METVYRLRCGLVEYPSPRILVHRWSAWFVYEDFSVNVQDDDRNRRSKVRSDAKVASAADAETSHTSHLSPHTSHFTPLTSHTTHHTPHTSHTTPHLLELG